MSTGASTGVAAMLPGAVMPPCPAQLRYIFGAYGIELGCEVQGVAAMLL